MTTYVSKRNASRLTVITLFASTAIMLRALTVIVDALLFSMGIIPDAFGGYILKAFLSAMLLIFCNGLISDTKAENSFCNASVRTTDISAAAIIVLVSFALSCPARAYSATAMQLIFELMICGVLLPISEEMFVHGKAFERARVVLPSGIAILLAAFVSAVINPNEWIFCFAASALTGILTLCGGGFIRTAALRVFMSSALVLMRLGAHESVQKVVDIMVIMTLMCIFCGAISAITDSRKRGKKYE